MVAPVRPVNRTMVRGSGLRCVERSYAHPLVSRDASAWRLREAKKTTGDQSGVGAERDRAAKRPGRRDCAGAPQGAEPSERSERPAPEGKNRVRAPGA